MRVRNKILIVAVVAILICGLTVIGMAKSKRASVDKISAPGVMIRENDRVTIDYSNSKDGYVMIKCNNTNKKLKAIIYGPSYSKDKLKYTYNVRANTWEIFPLTDGNGKYTIGVYENISGTKYSTMISADINVTLTDEFAPFLRPNQYVNYEIAPNSVKKAEELCGDTDDVLKKVELIFDYAVNNLTYDEEKAKTVKSGYIPNLDDTLKTQKGICFDYASLMTGMLRSQGIPCKLVFGYAGKVYHAWVSVWTEETGWIDGTLFFDGNTWHRMDPTFTSSGKDNPAIQKYIGNNKNYSSAYIY